MPAYAAKATPDELWSLVHYVRSLSAAPAAR
jgi:mono/diheme cytochrome c family protein